MLASTKILPVFNPIGALRRRVRTWWHNRLPLTDTWTLTQRNVYILPTRAGSMMVATLLVLLIASINYQLNLGYLLTFMLAGASVIGMHVTHANLRGLTLNLIADSAHSMRADGLIYAGNLTQLSIRLTHTRSRMRPSVGLGLLGDARATSWSWTDVPAQGTSSVKVAFKPDRRGLHRVPMLTVETRFPLGTFRVWTVWRPKSSILVYPAPEPFAPPLPPGKPRAGGAGTARAQNTAEFEGVRAYRRGDPIKHVLWKKSARSDEWVSRDTQSSRHDELWLNHAQAGARAGSSIAYGELDEAIVSRLTAWVLAADKLGIDYGLRLPHREIQPSAGEAHKRACLEALALC